MVDRAMDKSKNLCSEMWITMERRIRQKKRMDGEGLTDAAGIVMGLGDAELRREMLYVIDRLTEEISGRFQQVHDLANKYAFLTPSNQLDDDYDYQLGEVDDDMEKEEFFFRKEEIAIFCGSFRTR